MESGVQTLQAPTPFQGCKYRERIAYSGIIHRFFGFFIQGLSSWPIPAPPNTPSFKIPCSIFIIPIFEIRHSPWVAPYGVSKTGVCLFLLQSGYPYRIFFQTFIALTILWLLPISTFKIPYSIVPPPSNICHPTSSRLKFTIPRSPRKRNHIPNIRHARYKLHHALKTKSKTRMRHRSKTAGI